MLANVLCALITFLFITDIAHIENVRQCGWQGAVRDGQGEGVMAALVIRLGVVVGVCLMMGLGFMAMVGLELFCDWVVEEYR